MGEAIWSIEDFLSQYTSQSTIRTYYATYKDYFKFIYPKLRTLPKEKLEKELIEHSIQYIKEDRDYRKDLIKYKKTLNKIAPISRTVRTAALLRFLEDNKIEFSRTFVRNLYGKGNTEPISKEHVPDNQEIAKIIEYMPIQGKTLTLVLSSSGMRIGEALQLVEDDLELDSDPTRIKVKREYTKTKKGRVAFISTEATNILKEWLDYRKDYISTKPGSRKYKTDQNDPRVFPFTILNFRHIWARALKKAGLHEKDLKTGRLTIHPHNLRKFFRTYGKWSTPDVAEALMGHTSGLNAIYARLDQAEELLIEGYREAEPHLCILSENKATLELKEKVEKQEDEYHTLTRLMNLKTNNLELELLELKTRYQKTLKQHDKDFQGFIAVWRKDTEEYQSMINDLVERVDQLENN